MSINNENKIKQKTSFDIYNLESNSLISFNFNFDILKSAIIELIKNQKYVNNEIKTLKSELLQQKKYSNEIELTCLELKLSSDKNPKNNVNIENQIKLINSKLIKLEEQIDNLDNEEVNQINFEMNNTNNNDNIKENNNDKENNNIDESNNLKKSKEVEALVNDLGDIKIKQINLEKDFNEYKSKFDVNISKNIMNSLPDIEDNLSSKIKLVEKKLNEKINKENTDINIIKEDLEKIKNNLSEQEISRKKISELTSSNELLISKVNILNDSFHLYTKLNEFNQYKNDILEYIKGIREDINKNVELNRRGLYTLKNQFDNHINDKKDHNNLELLLKKFDILQNMSNKFKEFQDDMEEKEKKRIVIDPNHFINKEIFEEFLKNERKNFDEYKKECFELKKDLTELKNKEMGNKATLKDLKALEDNIYKLFDELKASISRRFIDRNTLSKNTKILEMQTKQLIEDNKKLENKETWLLSKKPFGGHLCASCESYIGDLNPDTTSKYIPWNKYPQKESTEKVYKVEGGISKIFNIFNSKLSNLKSNNNNKNNTNILKTNNEENSQQNSKNTINDSNNNIYIQLNSFSTRANSKKKFKFSNKIEDLDNINNLPIIKKSIKKNNSTMNVFNSENTKIKNFKNITKGLESNSKSRNNVFNKSIQIGEEEDYNLNIKENGIYTKDNEKEKENIKEIYQPIITKIIKKH